MDRSLIISILFILAIENLRNVNGFAGYNWISLNLGDTIPENAVAISEEYSESAYIGRARHYDEILPAVIAANGSAFISSCHKLISKEQFEILTTSNNGICEWKKYGEIGDIDDTVLRVGTAFNGEPIFVGNLFNSYSYYGIYHITSIYLTRNVEYNHNSNDRYNGYGQQRYLSCKTNTTWIDSSSAKVPNNTISGGQSEDGYEMYVARLKRNCEIVTGQVIPKMGIATAFLSNDLAIEALYCQVLVGEPNEYTWVSASDGEIPDYAVVNEKYGNELSYVVRFNKTIGHLAHSEALRHQLEYDVLVRK